MNRSIFNEIKEGMELLEQHFQGKATLRTTQLSSADKPALDITPSEVKSIREHLNLSQAVFADRLRTSVRTYQGWEQGKTKPNPQAILLLRMVERDPATFKAIAAC